jgi:hypothetical protein
LSSFEQSQLPVLPAELTSEVYFVSGNIKMEVAAIPSHTKEKLDLLHFAVKQYRKALEYQAKHMQCITALAEALQQIHILQEKVRLCLYSI